MTLRQKTLVVLVGTLLGLVSMLLGVVAPIVLVGFRAVEDQDTRQNVQRVQEALTAEISKLDLTAQDWAEWDDTYAFVQDANPLYRRTNLNAATIARLKLSVMILLDPAGHAAFSTGFDPTAGQPLPLPAGLTPYLAQTGPLLAGVRHLATSGSQSGLVVLPSGPLILVARPILTGEGQGPNRGVLVFGRTINNATTAAIAARTHVDLALYAVTDPRLPADVAAVAPALQVAASPTLRPQSDQLMVGYALTQDVANQPALILRVQVPRPIYRQAQTTLWGGGTALISLGLVFLALAVGLLERGVLAPLTRLSHEMVRITRTGDLHWRLPTTRRDEIGQLGEVANTMLTRIADAHTALQTSEARYRQQAQELAGARDAAEAANQAKSAFLANISHDFRTPITAILGYSEFILEAVPADTPQLATDVRYIQEAADGLLRLVDGVLSLARMEAGQLVIRVEPVVVADLLLRVTELSRVRLTAGSHQLQVECAPEVGVLDTDPVAVQQGLLYLLDHVAAITPAGILHLEVTTDAAPAGSIHFSVSSAWTGSPLNEAAGYSSLALSQRLCQTLGGSLETESSTPPELRLSIHLPRSGPPASALAPAWLPATVRA